MKYLAPLLFTFIAACTTEPSDDSTSRAVISTTCAADADCPTGFECEIEVEHGVTTSFCQAHDSSQGCPAGYELEIEHGQAYCKPHGGDDAGTGTGTSGTCASDVDCPAGQECEVEIEHGTQTSSCKPHGG